MTIPAVGPKTATRMLLMLRSRSFDTARQAAAVLGLVPVERTSGTSVRGRPTLSRAGNPRLRAALHMAAVVGIRKNPDLRAQYGRLLARGKCKMAALGAAMRKLVHLCFGVLEGGGEEFDAAVEQNRNVIRHRCGSLQASGEGPCIEVPVRVRGPGVGEVRQGRFGQRPRCTSNVPVGRRIR